MALEIVDSVAGLWMDEYDTQGVIWSGQYRDLARSWHVYFLQSISRKVNQLIQPLSRPSQCTTKSVDAACGHLHFAFD